MPPYTQPAQRNEIVDWYQSMPPITKAIMTLSAATTIAPALGLLNPYNLILDWNGVSKLQLWRLVTSFFVNKLGLAFAMNLFFLYRYSLQLETEVFQGRTADYVYFYIVTSGLQLAAARYLRLYVLSDGLMLSIAYLWSRHYQDSIVSFMYGIRFKAVYLPWVLVAFDFLMSGNIPVPSLVGIGASYVYYYLTHIYPSQGGRRFLTTPAILQRMFPTVVPRGGFRSNAGFQMWPGNMQQQQQQRQSSAGTSNMFGGHSWGRGHRLGG